MKKLLFYIVLICSFLLISNFAYSKAIYEDFIGWKREQKTDPLRVYVIKNPQNPCDPGANFKYPVNFILLTNRDAAEWLVKKGLMRKISGGKYKWTKMYNDWQDAKKLKSLYWQKMCLNDSDDDNGSDDPHVNFCRKYASTAVEQANEQLGRNCGKEPKGRWSTSWKAHYKWCLGNTQSNANYETKGRSNFLKISCGKN